MTLGEEGVADDDETHLDRPQDKFDRMDGASFTELMPRPDQPAQ